MFLHGAHSILRIPYKTVSGWVFISSVGQGVDRPEIIGILLLEKTLYQPTCV